MLTIILIIPYFEAMDYEMNISFSDKTAKLLVLAIK